MYMTYKNAVGNSLYQSLKFPKHNYIVKDDIVVTERKTNTKNVSRRMLEIAY